MTTTDRTGPSPDERGNYWLWCSVSGGRTSALMAYLVNTRKSEIEDHLGIPRGSLVVKNTFANTGREHDDTLRFLRDFGEWSGIEITWLEAVVNPEHGKGIRHRIVDFDSAFRMGDYKDPRHPYTACMAKYGIYNHAFKSCTSRMKVNTMDSYRRGFHREYWTAIGIRADETRRVSKNAGVNFILYPLVDVWETDKDDVLEFFSRFDWDLGIPEWLGNCVTCYKKSQKKLAAIAEHDRALFDFNIWAEENFGRGTAMHKKDPDAPTQHSFRGNVRAVDLLSFFDDVGGTAAQMVSGSRGEGGCGESCEIYEMDDQLDLFD